MNKIKVLAIPRKKVFAIAQFAALLGIAVLAPLLYSQPVTGAIVNATLFVSAVLLGTQSAILIGLIPSLIALSVGLLPIALAPMVPFIITGNAILILVFGFFKKKNYWLGVISAGVLKFLFLFSSSSIVIDLILKKEIAQKAAAMMSLPQLFTALAGGAIAYLILKSVKKI